RGKSIMFSHKSGQVLALVATGALAAAGLVAVPASAQAATGQLGNITSFAQAGDTYTVRSGAAALRVVAQDNDLLRVQVAPDGTFTDPLVRTGHAHVCPRGSHSRTMRSASTTRDTKVLRRCPPQI
ncbi:MAG: hypothetical protein ABIW49_01895, partial [Knoellia sp.]